jgi:Mg2+ and Co2+ transporter CorA
VFGLSMDEWSVIGIIFGMVMAFCGLAVNVWFKRQHLNLARDMAGEDGE